MLKNLARIVIGTGAAGALSLGLASIASAEEPPPPSGDDVTSIFNVGDSNLGASAGMDGYSASLAGNTLTSSGWPVSRTTLTGPGYAYSATTDYDYEGGVEHWSSLESMPVSFDNHFKVTPMEGLDQNADVRLGSVTVNCTEFVNCSVGGSMG